MADVLKLVPQGAAPDRSVSEFLRELADIIDGQDAKPNKAVVVLHTNLGSQFGVHSRFCNATLIERTGMLQIALHDSLSD